MNEKIEKELKKEIENCVPDVFDDILAESKNNSNNNITIFAVPQKKKKNMVAKTISAIAAVLAVVIIGSFAFLNGKPVTQNCHVEFNVNPCVVMDIGKDERVTNVRAENDDAKVILEDMDFENTDMDVAINALMFSMIKHGYIDEMTNSVLVSVSEDSSLDYENISQHIIQKVNEVFSKSAIEGSVMVQPYHEDNEITSIAKKYKISEGKAALIKNLLDKNMTSFSFDALSKLSINELNILMNENDAQSDVTVSGTASRKAYIGEETAQSIAYRDAGVKEADVKHNECSLDFDDGMLVYDVEFIVAGAVHEYEIDALTGKILKKESEPVKENQTTTVEESSTTAGQSAPSYKTKEEIKTMLLEINNLTSSDYKTFEIEMEIENGRAVYEVEFFAKGTKYEYEVDALDATIISCSSKSMTTTVPATTAPETVTQQTSGQYEHHSEDHNKDHSVPTSAHHNDEHLYIGFSKAKKIACENAGITDPSKVRAEIEFGYNNGIVYCVEFHHNGMEYEYEINAHTGEIVDFEKEND